LNETIQLPKSSQIDKPLIMGAALFGIGWGLLGICPGPALAMMTVGGYKIILFILAMLVGMELHRMTRS